MTVASLPSRVIAADHLARSAATACRATPCGHSICRPLTSCARWLPPARHWHSAERRAASAQSLPSANWRHFGRASGGTACSPGSVCAHAAANPSPSRDGNIGILQRPATQVIHKPASVGIRNRPRGCGWGSAGISIVPFRVCAFARPANAMGGDVSVRSHRWRRQVALAATGQKSARPSARVDLSRQPHIRWNTSKQTVGRFGNPQAGGPWHQRPPGVGQYQPPPRRHTSPATYKQGCAGASAPNLYLQQGRCSS